MRTWLRVRIALAAGAVAAFALVAPGSSPQAAARPQVPSVRADWRTYGFDLARTGYNPVETTLGVSNVGNLHEVWSFDLHGTAANQPSYASKVMIEGHSVDVVYQGASNGFFFAIRADTGQRIWRRFTGRGVSDGCGTYGISGSSPIDRTRNLVYVPGGDGRVYAFDLATGRPASGWPIAVTRDPAHEYVWSAPTLANDRMYVPVASYCDVTPYYGRVVEISLAPPARVAGAFFVTDDPTVSGGGIWGWGGASVDEANGDVYVATGNALFDPESYGYSDQIVRLTAGLSVVAANYPGLNFTDVDFGSTPVLYQAPGCPPQLAAQNKDGHLFVYDRDSISDGPVQSVLTADFNISGPIGLVAYSPVANMIYMNNPAPSPDATYSAGMLAFKVQADCMLALAWQQPYGGGVFHNTMGTPTVANGVVYAGDGAVVPSHLRAMDASTGQVLWQTSFANANYSTPIVLNGHVFIATYDNHLHAYGI
jgi:outer membrane protein assembly factor BamB